MLLSTCCDAPVYNEFDHICSKCKEHCDVYNPEVVVAMDACFDVIKGIGGSNEPKRTIKTDR